jgi:hypothetical protein
MLAETETLQKFVRQVRYSGRGQYTGSTHTYCGTALVSQSKCWQWTNSMEQSPLPDKLTGHQLIKKFPAFYGTRRFITAVTNAHHLFLSRARSIQSTPHPLFCRSILILFSYLRLRVRISPVPNTCHMPRTSKSS